MIPTVEEITQATDAMVEGLRNEYFMGKFVLRDSLVEKMVRTAFHKGIQWGVQRAQVMVDARLDEAKAA